MNKIKYSIVTLNFSRKIQMLVFLTGLFFLVSPNARADNTAVNTNSKSATVEITKNSLQAQINAIKDRQGFDEIYKSKILKLYQSAQDNLTNAESFKSREAAFKQALKQAPEATRKLQKEIEQTQPKLTKQNLEDFSGIPVEELKQRLIIEKGNIGSLDEQSHKLENELALQSSRPQSIRQELLLVQQNYEVEEKKLISSPAGSNVQLETEAQQVFLKTLSDSLTAQIKMLDAEAISNPARVELLKAQIQNMELRKNTLTLIINSIESVLDERRQQQAKDIQDALSQAEKELSGKHPLIQSITRKNIQFSRELQAINDRIEYYNEQKTKLDLSISQIDSDYKSAEKKISLAGLSPALGKILHNQRRLLLTQDAFLAQSETIQNETATTSLEQFKVDSRLKQLMDTDAELKELMNQQVDLKLPTEQRMMIQAEVRVLINHQKELLNKLSTADSAYLRILGDFDFSSQQLRNLKSKFTAYLDEKLLWVKSSEPINAGFIKGLYHSTQWLLSPFNWFALAKDIVKLITQNLFLTLVVLVGFFFLLMGKKAGKK